MKKLSIIVFTLTAVIQIANPSVFAGSVKEIPGKVGEGIKNVAQAPGELVQKSAEESKAQGPFNKIGRGFTNIVTSPGEIPLQITDMAQENDYLTAAFGGTLKGVVFMAGRLLNGVYDVVTFPVPLPAYYAPLWHPETIFDGFNEVL